jgi:ABC-type bacteriocin/lantibiotic exporter with double-glycine peptidase domain
MMILTYLGIQVEYDTIVHLLKVRSFGASGQNLKYLAALGVAVSYREGSVEELSAYCLQGYPCIVLVRTGELTYWSYPTDHAVVVVGFDEQQVYVHDPAFVNAPIAISKVAFELAWMDFDYRYALITR